MSVTSGQKFAELAAAEPPPMKRTPMSLTDYAGVAGLIAAALLALWMFRGARTQPPTGRHRGNPALRLPKPTSPERAARR